MGTPPTESRTVPVDVLPPVPADAAIQEPRPPLAGLKTFYHPASGVAILGIDLLFFGPEAFFPPDMPFLCPLAFLATLPFVYYFQTQWSKDRPLPALGKAFVGAFLAGLPFSIAGTIFGAAVIALSCLPRHPIEALKKFPALWSSIRR